MATKHFAFVVGETYTRSEVQDIVGVPDGQGGGDWNTGYHKHSDDWFIFCGIGAAGRTGHDNQNQFVRDVLVWYGRTDSRLHHPSIQSLINPTGRVYIFFREGDREPFMYAGLGSVKSVEDTVPVKVVWRIMKGGQKSSDGHTISGPIALAVVTSAKEIRSNVRRFNRDASSFPGLVLDVLRRTRYWVYDPDEDLFGPSKFVGFRSMTFGNYEAGRAGRTNGATFDGGVTKEAIEQALGEGYGGDDGMSSRLVSWGRSVLGEEVFDGIDDSKWRFVRLPQERQYWAFFANPDSYHIEAALQALETEAWEVKRSDVKRGDRVLLWRGLKDHMRGVVGLAEVTSDPAIMRESEQSRWFYVGDPPDTKERRVWVRMYTPPRAPLWLHDDDSGTLQSLKVARSRGGTVFHVKPEEWHDTVMLLGGWRDAEDAEVTLAAAADAIDRAERPGARGQGFKVSPEVRKEIEKYTMRKAEDHFRGLGYNIEDVSGNNPFDLLCIRGDKELRVEVKGTQTTGEEVLLTPNEVKHAREHADRMVLFVVHSVWVENQDGKVRVTGGETEIIEPWDIDQGTLNPIGFKYGLPGDR